jgi:small-conductance mechanosensitive channel
MLIFAAAASEAPLNLSERSARLAAETSAWLGGNGVDILIATGFGLVIALILLGLRSLGCRLVGRLRADPHWPLIFARALARTNLFFIIMTSAELVAEHAATPHFLLRIIHILFVVAAAIQAAVWGRELVLGYVQHRVGGDDEQSRLASAIGIIRLLITTTLATIAIILILSNLGVNVTGLVAGLGIGGIAIGLAAQGIFKDLFAALSIIFDKPFRRGDSIRFDGVNGHVEDIGLKTTRLRSVTGEEVIVSNAQLLDKQIHNFGRLDHRRLTMTFALTYQTPPEVCASVPDLVRGIVEAHPRAAFIRCGLTGFGASSLDFELQFDVNSPDYEFAFGTRSAIGLEILKAFNAAGIAFAYPTQTSFTAGPDGTLIMPYPDPDESAAGPARSRSDSSA